MLRSERCDAAAAALKGKSCCLEVLGLYGGVIGELGAMQLATAIKVNTTLRELDLYGNQLGPMGAKMLAAALQENRSCRCIYIHAYTHRGLV